MLDSYIDIRNNSHYLDNHSKRFFRLPNPQMLSVQRSRQFSYYVRCAYHYDYVKSLGGFTLFYTLTYNNKSLPYFYGVPCFNYNDLRYLLSSCGFVKTIQRHYGYRLQYLVTCELGDGKGVRGFSGNPHYHCLFFLTPNFKQGRIYKPFNPKIFKHLILKYWQGSEKYRPKDYKFGICMPGDDDGLVNSYKAVNYVCKYVLKDVGYYSLYRRLYSAAIDSILSRLRTMKKAQNCFINFLDKHPEYNCMSAHEIPAIQVFLDKLFDRLYKKEIRNLYMPKVRISHGVGLSALNHINSDGLTVNVLVHDVPTAVSLPLYLFRKKYYDVVVDAKGNNKYVLNNDGLNVRALNFEKSVDEEVRNLSSLLDDWYKGASPYTYYQLLDYVYYDKIYRGRYCSVFDEINPVSDYYQFSVSEFFLSEYDDLGLLQYPFSRSITYEYHPYFVGKRFFLEEIDKIKNNYYLSANKSNWENYRKKEKVRKIFSKYKFDSFVKSL